MPAFWRVMDATAIDEAARVRRFDQEVVAAHPGLYGPVIPLGTNFDVGYYLHRELSPLLATMREVESHLAAQIPESLDRLTKTFGKLGEMTVYTGPSLFTTNGQVRIVGGKPVVVFGVDVQAYAERELLPGESRYDMRAYVAHELFHAHHYAVNAEMRAVANTLFDEELGAPLYVNLWIEGLATCVSMGVDGDGSPARALMSERLARELPGVFITVARELASKLDSRSREDARDYFWLGGERKDIPPRSAYGVGAWVAGDILSREGKAVALRLSGTRLRAEVAASLARLAKSSAFPDWNSFCQKLD
jgi:hypothetical protein